MVDTLPRIFADESGNTGEDLLSLDQPIFAVGSVHLTDEAAVDLLSSTEIGDRPEWKFSRLRKSGPGRRSILQILNGLSPATGKWAAAHKRYMISCKIVDSLLEPVLHAAGVNIYDKAGQVVLANAWHEAIPATLGEEGADRFFNLFVQMFRSRTSAAFNEFYTALEELTAGAPEPTAEHLEVLLESRPHAEGFLLDPKADWDDLDPAQPFLMPLLSAWDEEIGTPYSVIHDQVKGVERWQRMIEPYLFSPLPRRPVGHGERTWSLPLFATDVSFADSRDHPQLQVADILAGAANYWLRGLLTEPDDRPFHEGIEKAAILNMVVLALWPEAGADFDEADAAAAFESDPPSQVAAFIRERDAIRQ